MNERIKELMRESGVKTLFPGDPGAGACGPIGVSFGLSETQKLEKFAELIVRECATLAYDGPNGILEHFGLGVEE